MTLTFIGGRIDCFHLRGNAIWRLETAQSVQVPIVLQCRIWLSFCEPYRGIGGKVGGTESVSA